LHLLDDKQRFMEASHPPLPFDQPCLVALEFLFAGAPVPKTLKERWHGCSAGGLSLRVIMSQLNSF
jgi:hypothetical protein